MSTYIGARYVPKFMGTYDATQSYENMSVVDNGMGTSYISKVSVPANIPLTNTDYWAIYGASNGAIIGLQNQIDRIKTYLTISDMLAFPDFVEDDIIHVMGYYDPQDGGESYFIVVDNNLTGYNIMLSSGLYARLIVIDDTVNPAQFGAHENDDISYIMTAMQSVAGTVYIDKNYKIDSAVTLTANLIGNNRDTVKLTLNASISCNNYTGSIRDLNIDATTLNDYAFKLTHFHKTASIENVIIECIFGISIAQSWYCNIINVRIVIPTSATGIGLRIYSIAAGGVNAAAFTNVNIWGGLHSILFDREDPSVPAMCEGLTFLSSAFEHSHGAAIYVTYNRDVAAITFNSCYFEHINDDSVDTISAIYRSGNPSADTIVVDNCMIRNAPTGIPLFGDGIQVEVLKNVHSTQLFKTGAQGSLARGYANISRQFADRWSDLNYSKVVIPKFAPFDVLNHEFNSDFKEYDVINGDTDLTIKFNNNNYVAMGFIDLFLAFRPNGYNYNHIILRLMYGFGSGIQRCDVNVEDKYESYAGAFGAITFAAAITDTPERKIVLTMTTADPVFIGKLHAIMMGGFDYSDQLTGDQLTLA